MTSTGRFTLPSEENFAEKTKELAELCIWMRRHRCIC